ILEFRHQPLGRGIFVSTKRKPVRIARMPKGVEKSLQRVLSVLAHNDYLLLKGWEDVGSVNAQSIALESSCRQFDPTYLKKKALTSNQVVAPVISPAAIFESERARPGCISYWRPGYRTTRVALSLTGEPRAS